MISTLDGCNLSFNDECWIVRFEESGEYIESSIKCVYKGSRIQDNKPLIASLPPACSGAPIPETQTMHHFESVNDVDENFNLSECDVNHIVIGHLSAIETVIKKRLK